MDTKAYLKKRFQIKVGTLMVLTTIAFFTLTAKGNTPNATTGAGQPIATNEITTTDSQLTPDKATQQPSDALALDAFGLGKFSFGEYHDSTLGFIAKATGSSYIGNDNNAAAIELNGGPKIMRLNVTYGLALTDKQRVKVTAERLDEDLDFDFDSGTVTKWDGQNALGASYAYLVDNTYIESFGFGGSVSHSGSKDLSDATIYDSLNDVSDLEHRRIAGANSANLHLDVATHLWPHSRLSGGLDYDEVHFDTKYDDQDVHGLGGHIKIEQRVLPSVKLTGKTYMQQAEHEYIAGIGWLTPSPKGTQMELELTTDYNHSLATRRYFYTNGVRLNMNFGVTDENNKGTYSDLNAGNHETLLDWTRTPAVRMSEVLAVADSQIVGSSGATVTIACPASTSIITPVSGNTYTAPGGWTGNSETGDAGSKVTSFHEAKYDTRNVSSGRCLYEFENDPTRILEMSNIETGEKTGNTWVPAVGTQYRCLKESGASQCRFEKM